MTTTLTSELTRQQADMLAIHFEPRWGSPFWLDALERCGLPAGHEFQSLGELRIFGPLDFEALRFRPLDYMIPRSRLSRLSQCFRSETGGTTGHPIPTLFDEAEFHRSFVHPFMRAADVVAFPLGGNWLFIGPTGPHIIGRAARALAIAMGAGDPHMIDFDPRWYRKLAAGSIGRRRYLDHVVEQSLATIKREPIDVLFSTPAVLDALSPRMTPAQRHRIRGIHYGGQRLDALRYRELREDLFPYAAHLSGYGNSLFGCALEVPRTPSRPSLDYHLPHEGWFIELLDWDGSGPLPPPEAAVPSGKRGRMLAHRFSPTCLLLNLVESDTAVRLDPDLRALSAGFRFGAFSDPLPPESDIQERSAGIY